MVVLCALFRVIPSTFTFLFCFDKTMKNSPICPMEAQHYDVLVLSYDSELGYQVLAYCILCILLLVSLKLCVTYVEGVNVQNLRDVSLSQKKDLSSPQGQRYDIFGLSDVGPISINLTMSRLVQLLAVLFNRE